MNETLKKYTHKETWSRRGNDFLVEVVRWETMSDQKFNEMKKEGYIWDQGRFIWNVYCYIYPKHSLFDKIKNEDMSDCLVNSFHGGCTLAKWHIAKDGNVMSKQYGCDYAHYRDERFSFIQRPEDALEVFNDAGDLFNELEERNNEHIPKAD